jgi:hypothetical protein
VEWATADSALTVRAMALWSCGICYGRVDFLDAWSDAEGGFMVTLLQYFDRQESALYET